MPALNITLSRPLDEWLQSQREKETKTKNKKGRKKTTIFNLRVRYEWISQPPQTTWNLRHKSHDSFFLEHLDRLMTTRAIS